MLGRKHFCLLRFSVSGTANKVTKDSQEKRQNEIKTLERYMVPLGKRGLMETVSVFFQRLELLPGGGASRLSSDPKKRN